MSAVGMIFDVYLNINILLIVALCVWAGTRAIMRLTGMSYAFTLKLRLLKLLIVACLAGPALVVLYDHYLRETGTAAAFSLSLSDLVVAQYLQGSFDMKAADLEQILALRGRMTEDVLSAQSMYALVGLGLFALGALIGTMRLLSSLFALRQLLSGCFVWRQFGSLHLLLSDSVTTPFSTRGLFRRYIVIPTHMLSNSQDLRIALGHELQHMRQGDTEWELALEFFRPLFFWNPAFYLIKRHMEQLRELSCDQQVVMRTDVSVKDYCACLLRVCEEGLRQKAGGAAAIPRVAFVQIERSPIASNSERFLQHRLLSLFDGEKRHASASTLLAWMLPILALVGFASILLQKPNDWSHERIMFSTVINLDRLAERQR